MHKATEKEVLRDEIHDRTPNTSPETSSAGSRGMKKAAAGTGREVWAGPVPYSLEVNVQTWT